MQEFVLLLLLLIWVSWISMLRPGIKPVISFTGVCDYARSAVASWTIQMFIQIILEEFLFQSFTGKIYIFGAITILNLRSIYFSRTYVPPDIRTYVQHISAIYKELSWTRVCEYIGNCFLLLFSKVHRLPGEYLVSGKCGVRFAS